MRLTENIAAELREQGVDVNCVAPGSLATRMHERCSRPAPSSRRGLLRARARAAALGGVPCERGAELAVFLGSAASDGVTGKLLSAVLGPVGELPSTARSSTPTSTRCGGSCPADRGLAWGEV